jgi:hypothetical protein
MALGAEKECEVVHSRVLQLVAHLFSSGCIQTQDVTTLQRPLPDDAMKIWRAATAKKIGRARRDLIPLA